MKMHLKTPKKRLKCEQKHLIAGICMSLFLTAYNSYVTAADNTGPSGEPFTPPATTSLFAAPADLSKPPVTPLPSNSDTGTGPDGQIMGVLDNNASESDEEKADKLRYKLIGARVDLETGHIYNATKSLNEIMPEYKNDAEYLGFTANAENYGGNWQQAEQLLKNAQAISPENQDVAELLNSVRREHAQNVEVDYDWMRYGNSNENISKLSGYVDAAPHVIVGASVEDNYILGRDLRLVNGFVGDTNSNKQQEELYAQYATTNGQNGKVAVYSNNYTAGAGGYYGFLSPLGETNLTAEWARPYWDIPEAVFDDATRDRLAFMQTVKPSTRWTIDAGLGVNRYDTEAEDNVAQSISADGNVVYTIIEGIPYRIPQFNVGYTLDAEYMQFARYSIDDSGDWSREFPLVSREIHTLFGEVNYDFTQRLYAEGMAGYEYDRLGGNGPTVEGKITYEFTKAFDIQLRAYYGLDTTNTQNSITDFGGYLRWRF